MEKTQVKEKVYDTVFCSCGHWFPLKYTYQKDGRYFCAMCVNADLSNHIGTLEKQIENIKAV